jgi:hypothetical protein
VANPKTRTIRAVEVKAYAVVCANGKHAQRYKSAQAARGGKLLADTVACGPHTVIPLSGTWPRQARAKARRR